MRYAQIRKMDISNGIGIGIALFVQGCPFHCNGCFNPETWDFNKGLEWTNTIQDQFLELIDRPYISRVSILGGEPLAEQNIETVTSLLKIIKERYPYIKIWVYTGFLFQDINSKYLKDIDVLVDGQFILAERDLTLMFRGSKNQRVIDVQKTLKESKIIELEL